MYIHEHVYITHHSVLFEIGWSIGYLCEVPLWVLAGMWTVGHLLTMAAFDSVHHLDDGHDDAYDGDEHSKHSDEDGWHVAKRQEALVFELHDAERWEDVS